MTRSSWNWKTLLFKFFIGDWFRLVSTLGFVWLVLGMVPWRDDLLFVSHILVGCGGTVIVGAFLRSVLRAVASRRQYVDLCRHHAGHCVHCGYEIGWRVMHAPPASIGEKPSGDGCFVGKICPECGTPCHTLDSVRDSVLERVLRWAAWILMSLGAGVGAGVVVLALIWKWVIQ